MPNIIHITDFSAPELDIFARKTENQLLNREHPEEGIFIAESPKVVERALDGGYAPYSSGEDLRMCRNQQYVVEGKSFNNR